MAEATNNMPQTHQRSLGGVIYSSVRFSRDNYGPALLEMALSVYQYLHLDQMPEHLRVTRRDTLGLHLDLRIRLGDNQLACGLHYSFGRILIRNRVNGVLGRMDGCQSGGLID